MSMSIIIFYRRKLIMSINLYPSTPEIKSYTLITGQVNKNLRIYPKVQYHALTGVIVDKTTKKVHRFEVPIRNIDELTGVAVEAWVVHAFNHQYIFKAAFQVQFDPVHTQEFHVLKNEVELIKLLDENNNVVSTDVEQLNDEIVLTVESVKVSCWFEDVDNLDFYPSRPYTDMFLTHVPETIWLSGEATRVAPPKGSYTTFAIETYVPEFLLPVLQTNLFNRLVTKSGFHEVGELAKLDHPLRVSFIEVLCKIKTYGDIYEETTKEFQQTISELSKSINEFRMEE